MCMLCVEWEKGKLTSKEAMQALSEMLNTEEDETKLAHLFELSDKIIDKDIPFGVNDFDLDYLEDLDESDCD